jgi:hypothetical protein
MNPEIVVLVVVIAIGVAAGVLRPRVSTSAIVAVAWLCVWLPMVVTGWASPGDTGKEGSILWGVIFVVIPSAGAAQLGVAMRHIVSRRRA